MKGRILVTASMVVALAAPAYAQLRDGRENPLTAARDLYASARYDEALAVLSGLPSDVVATDRKSIEQYRSLCLLALGRSSEAEGAIAAVITADPLTFSIQLTPDLLDAIHAEVVAVHAIDLDLQPLVVDLSG